MDTQQDDRGLLRDERGATAVEYGLIISLIVLAMLASLQNFARANTKMWNSVSEEVLKH